MGVLMTVKRWLLLVSLAAIVILYYNYNGFIKLLLELQPPTFENVKNLPVDHHYLLRYIKENHLKPPSVLPYPQAILKGDPSAFTTRLTKIFGQKKNGFFIECGANDGHFLSNTWVLERDFNWTGLLIEANPEMNAKLVTRNRKVWFADVCLSPFNNVSQIEFLVSAKRNYEWEQGLGKIAMSDDIVYTKIDPKRKIFKFQSSGMVKCFPLLSLMLALNVNYVDYLSLDVQGVESKIMKTLPFDERLVIDVFQVEFELDPEGKSWMKSFMESKGYKLIFEGSVDLIFKRIQDSATAKRHS